jgi:uncharacterized membrane protein YeaQ/YmgE (transglycosylase-associated protein family)
MHIVWTLLIGFAAGVVAKLTAAVVGAPILLAIYHMFRRRTA